jgi:hypothetical protein
MSIAAILARLGARIGTAGFQVLDAGVAAPDIAINGPSHVARME